MAIIFRSALCGLAVLSAVGCASTGSGSKGPPPAAPPAEAAAYYPLTQGWRWAYDVERADGQKILATYAVVARTGEVAEIESGGERMRYAITGDGIQRRDEGGPADFVLKSPVAVGTSWPVLGGSARIVAVGEEVVVDAGKFSGCATVEEQRTDPVRMTRTTFAPGTGPVVIESRIHDRGAWLTTLRATLRAVTRPGEDPTAD